MATKHFNYSIGDIAKGVVKRICSLKPIEPEHQIIHLEGGKNTIGRNKETGIRDVNCSKRQLQLEVDLEKCNVKMKVLGVNPCGVNGLMVMHDTECELEHGDIVEIVYGRHPFEVIFKPPPPKRKSTEASMGTEEKVADKHKEVEETSADTWDSIENGKLLMFTSAGVRASEKIAAYDIDGTIIKTKSGNVFPKNADDWQIIYPEVPAKLKRLHRDGFKIVFFTNQSGIDKGKVDVNEFKKKICAINQKLGVPIQVFIATSDGYFRKPMNGMWEHMKTHKNDSVELDLSRCFYVGDAAGRLEVGSGSTKRRKDHSHVDRFFASNIGVSFYTPEEHFLNQRKKDDWAKPEFEPKSIHVDIPLLDPKDTKIPSDSCEIIIMVGLPGSGKSHFTHHYLSPLNYKIANSDTLGNVAACLKVCEASLSAGTSCVVDNTNVDVESRKKFLDLAKKMNVPCRCFLMNSTLAQMKHNIAFRHLTDKKHSKVNDMVFNMLKKRYVSPSLCEGFTKIVTVNLKPKFETAKDEELYKLYLVEKAV